MANTKEIIKNIENITFSKRNNNSIGGGMIYTEALPLADRLYLTHVDTEFPEADTFFPEVNCDKWETTFTESHPTDDRHPYDFRYATYERKK